MKEIIVDTNAFLRLFLSDIPEQLALVKTLFQKAKRKEVLLVVPQIVVFELEFILGKYYLIPKEERIEKLNTLVSMEYLKIQDASIFQQALQIFAVNNFSLVDSFLLAQAEEKSQELFTFDQAVQKYRRY